MLLIPQAFGIAASPASARPAAAPWLPSVENCVGHIGGEERQAKQAVDEAAGDAFGFSQPLPQR
jgi:hypothetical protein